MGPSTCSWWRRTALVIVVCVFCFVDISHCLVGKSIEILSHHSLFNVLLAFIVVMLCHVARMLKLTGGNNGLDGMMTEWW